MALQSSVAFGRQTTTYEPASIAWRRVIILPRCFCFVGLLGFPSFARRAALRCRFAACFCVFFFGLFFGLPVLCFWAVVLGCFFALLSSNILAPSAG